MRRSFFVAPLALLLSLSIASGQGEERMGADTTAAKPIVGLTLTKNPTTAILWSIVPGGGQLYNHDYWKVGVFVAAAGWFGYRAIHFHRLFSDTRDQIAALDPGADSNASRLSVLRFQRESYRDDRDLSFAYFLMVEALGMIDAYVGAHLYDFTVDGMDGGLRLSPTRLSLRLQW